VRTGAPVTTDAIVSSPAVARDQLPPPSPLPRPLDEGVLSALLWWPAAAPPLDADGDTVVVVVVGVCDWSG